MQGLIVRGLMAALACGGIASAAQASSDCEVQLRPAAKPTSVGEDFDAVKRVDQDLRDYSKAAGKPLEWLTPERQLELIQQLPVANLLGVSDATVSVDPVPISRSAALAPAAPVPTGCVVRIMIPQAILERGGLAQRSLRIFGVVRRYEGGVLTGSFSAYSASPMVGFRLQSPDDLPAATALVETAYRGAVERFLQSSAKTLKK